MADVTRGDALFDEALDGAFAAQMGSVDELQGDGLAGDLVGGLVDNAHAAAPDDAVDGIAVGEDLAGL